MGDDDYLQLFLRETSFYNSIVLPIILPEAVRTAIPHLLQTWLRNYIGGVILYLASGGLWAFYIYYWKRNLYLPKGHANQGWIIWYLSLLATWWHV